MARGLNYQGVLTGLLVASGPGFATIKGADQVEYVIGDSATTLPGSDYSIKVKDSTEYNKREHMYLEADEHLYVYTSVVVAVTADNPAPGWLV